MSETIQSASDRDHPTEAELPTHSVPAEAQPLIVVGYSSKPEGRAALKRALREARLRDAALVVVDTSPEVQSNDLTDELSASGVTYEIRTPADVQESAEELIRIAETTDADFIVIGLRRRSPVGKLLLGSNAQRVLLDAACPVLAVKAEPSAE
jgi:nucleotide-binding universal stress UspA family protein